MLRKFGENYIAVPIGDDSDNFYGLITLNESGSFIWKNMEKDITETELVKIILENYDIDEKTAREDLNSFLDKADGAGLIDARG